MNPTTYIPIVVLWIVIFFLYYNKRKAVIIRNMIEKRKQGGNQKMKELAERFINKECVVYAFDSNHQYVGVIKEVTDGAILLEKDGKAEAINLDFVIRLREYPLNKKGKKVSVSLD